MRKCTKTRRLLYNKHYDPMTPEDAPRIDSLPEDFPVPEEDVIVYFDANHGIYPPDTKDSLDSHQT